MGAMNAAVLVSNVINRRKTWEEAVEQLEIFWTDEKKGLSSTPEWWWNNQNNQTNSRQIKMGMDEVVRKYFSVKKVLEAWNTQCMYTAGNSKWG